MRHLEFVGGASEKFWEIDRDATTVTVRFGRRGTNGQTQVKDLGSLDAAEAHVAKLVAEKVKKGYVERSAASLTTPPHPPVGAASVAVEPTVAEEQPGAEAAPPVTPAETDRDEDTWTVPSAWWRHAEPFRGRGPRRTATLAAPGAVAELRALAGDHVERIFDNPGSDADLVERARLHLGTPAGLLRRARQEAQPLGAAVVGAVLTASADWPLRKRTPAIADDWVAAHGIGFAAEAGALAAAVRVCDPARPAAYGPRAAMIVTGAQAHDVPTNHGQGLLTRMRALVAAADDAGYAEVVARLAEHRAGPLALRAATSYLVPTEPRWTDEDVALIRTSGVSGPTLGWLAASATTEAQATTIVDAAGTWAVSGRSELIYSMAAHVGPDVASLLARLLDGNLSADDRKRVLTILGQFPTDAAFDVLAERLDQKYVAPAVLEAIGRFPRRAMRLLATAATGTGATAGAARDLLRDHAISHPGLVGRTRPELGAAAVQVLERAASTDDRVAVAPPDRLPALLVRPPWTDRRARSDPLVLEGLAAPSPTRLAWEPGEQDEWAQIDTGYRFGSRMSWAELVNMAVRGETWTPVQILAMAPAELVRPHLRRFTPRASAEIGPSLRRLLGRMGDDAVAMALGLVLARPATLTAVLLPFEGSEIATHMAEWYGRSRSIRPVTVVWFDRHAAAAARDLVPVALGAGGKHRATTEAALRLLVQRGHGDAVRAAARTHSPDVIDEIERVLAVDPLQLLPARMPTRPAWLDPTLLPQVLLGDRGSALPSDAVGHLCTMLAVSKLDAPYAGIEVVREAVDPVTLAEMVWGLFDRWRAAGFPPKDGWVLDALGLVGDDATVRRLSPLIRAWPGESAHARAVAGLDVLSAIGSDVALMHLHGIAEKAKFKGLRTKARAKIDEVADGLGLTADQLADRLVPDFGLDRDGSLLLDYGDRRFRVGFDEQLKPTVADEDGARRKTLPKPGATDDPVLAPAAHSLFSGLKKDVKTVAAERIRRFEQAMVAGRRWTAAEQRALFVEHPLLWHLARRLVWATFDEGGELVASFRVAEDRTLADRADEEVAVPDEATVGIAHPLHLGDTLGAWSDVFADYEILQPFPQLGRAALRLTEAERTTTVLERFAGIQVPTGRILGLSHRGWERGMPLDAGIQFVTYKPVADGRSVVIDLDPGIIAGDAMEWAEQTMAGVWLTQGTAAEWGRAEGSLPFGLLDPITASEVLRDLAWLRS